MSKLSFLVAVLFLGLLTGATTAAQLPKLSLSAASSATADKADAPEPSLDQLIGILENDAARKKLVESLKAAAYKAPAPADAAAAGSGESGGMMRSIPGEVAAYSKALIAGLIGTGNRLLETGRQSLDLLSGTGSLDLPRIFQAILPVGFVAFVVFAVLLATRLVKRPIFERLALQAERAGPIRKLLLLALSSLIDALSVFLGWAGGYLAAVLFQGDSPNLNQALFLNAFLLIEAIKVVLAMFVAPQYPQLRLTPFSDRLAKYWYFWLSRLISFLGYTFLFVAPIVQENSSLAAANAVRFIVAFLSFVTVVWLILQNRTRVRDRMTRRFRNGNHSFGARFNAILGHVWWGLALVFVFAVFSTWLSSPVDGLTFLASASLKSIAAIAIGGLLVMILTRVISNGIPIPDGAKERLPLLERRVNSFIPNALTVIRVVVIIVVLAVVLQAWSLLDVNGWARTTAGQRVISGAVGAGVILLAGFTIFLMVSSWVEYRLNPNYGKVPTARERTLLSLFRNAFTITLAVLIIMLVLSQIGIDIGPLLAGAGVVGLAVGFGAQKLVQDIITGAFIQLENAMNEGDVVAVAGVSGVVERLTIRSVGLRVVDGTYHLIPFSSVDQVANMTKDFSHFVADLGVAYRENTEDVKQVMQDAFDILRDGDQGPNIIADFEMFGVNDLGDSSVVVRGRIKTLPGKQWGVGRAYREIVKRLCDERAIEMPFPNMTVWFGEDKRGEAPPARLATVSAGKDAPLIEGRERERAAVIRDNPTMHGSINRDGSPIPPDKDDLDDSGDRL